MRGKLNKNLLQLLLITLLIASIAMVHTTTAEPATTMFVEPGSFIDPDLGIGETITVDIKVTDVPPCMGYDFKLRYDTTVLDADTSIVGGFIPGPDGVNRIIWSNTIYEAQGYVMVTVTTKVPAPPVSGDGTLATITFTVAAIGSSYLNLDETMLLDPNALEMPHDVGDSYFTNTYLDQPCLWIRTHGGKVWPEHSKIAVGGLQFIYAKIVNTGGTGCFVKASFILWPTPVGPIEFESDTAWVEAGSSATVTARFVMPYPPGWYYVGACVSFGFDGSRWLDYIDYQLLFGGSGISRETATKFRIS